MSDNKKPKSTEKDNDETKKESSNYVSKKSDNTKIKHALGKEFPVQAREGILKTIKSFQKAI